MTDTEMKLDFYEPSPLPKATTDRGEWWLGIMRTELMRAHDFYATQYGDDTHALQRRVQELEVERTAWRDTADCLRNEGETIIHQRDDAHGQVTLLQSQCSQLEEERRALISRMGSTRLERDEARASLKVIAFAYEDGLFVDASEIAKAALKDKPEGGE